MKHYDPLRIEWDCRRGMLELDKVIILFIFIKELDFFLFISSNLL